MPKKVTEPNYPTVVGISGELGYIFPGHAPAIKEFALLVACHEVKWQKNRGIMGNPKKRKNSSDTGSRTPIPRMKTAYPNR